MAVIPRRTVRQASPPHARLGKGIDNSAQRGFFGVAAQCGACWWDSVRMNCRILYVVGSLGRGGAERQLFYLISEMDRSRCRPAVMTVDGSETDAYVPALRELGVPVAFAPAGVGKAGKFRAVTQFARQLGVEIIHSYSFYCNALAGLAAKLNGARSIGSIRSEFTLQQQISPRWWRLNVAYPRWQIWNSQTALDQVKELGGGRVRPEIVVVRNGLDLNALPTTPLPSGDVPIIAAVGSLLPIKRWDRLLAASAILAKQGHRFRVRVAGDGPLRAQLEEQRQALGLEQRVEFLGNVKDVAGFLSEATLLAHTAESEGCPNVVMEALAAGRPVIATNVGDVRFLVQDGVSGLVVPNTDGPELVQALGSLLGDAARRQEMACAARRAAEVQFGLDRLLAETFDVYRRAGWKA
jgi:glycosyltransferase involved in cell wall biosynthesis